MAVRTPLKLDGTDLKEMTSTEINAIKDQVRYLYGTDPSVTVGYVASGGDLGTINDTRMQAGAYSTHVSSYPSEATTAEPSTVTVGYSRLDQSTVDTSPSVDGSPYTLCPVYQSGGDIHAMTLTDFYDTFIYPAIDTLVGGSDQPGTFRIHTATSLSGHTLISSTPVFTDTRANTGAYTAAGIPETLDQPTTVTNFYLFRTNSGSAVSYAKPVRIRYEGGNTFHLQEYTTTAFNILLKNAVRHVASEVAGSKIRYSVNGSGSNRGSGMTNTILNGAGNYQQHYVNTDDYRAQEFPNGSATTAATYYLRIYQT
jgi:hypothetical protein